MQMRKTIGAAAAALALVPAIPVQAAPVLSLASGATTITCADGAGCDLNPLAGVVTFVGAVGNFFLNVSTGLGDAGTPTNLMDLNSVNSNAGLGGTLTIGFSDTGYTHIGTIAGSWGGTLSSLASGSTVSAAAWAGLDNALWSQDLALGSLGPFSTGAFSSSFSTLGPASGPYSLTQIITISSPGAVTYSGDFELKVPEPASLALVGLGLLGVGAARRRKSA